MPCRRVCIMTRSKKVSVGLHTFLLVERRSACNDAVRDYYVELAGRGGLSLSMADLARLMVELNKFKGRVTPDADEL